MDRLIGDNRRWIDKRRQTQAAGATDAKRAIDDRSVDNGRNTCCEWWSTVSCKRRREIAMGATIDLLIFYFWLFEFYLFWLLLDCWVWILNLLKFYFVCGDWDFSYYFYSWITCCSKFFNSENMNTKRECVKNKEKEEYKGSLFISPYTNSIFDIRTIDFDRIEF